jgi:hypothetical protein
MRVALGGVGDDAGEERGVPVKRDRGRGHWGRRSGHCSAYDGKKALTPRSGHLGDPHHEEAEQMPHPPQRPALCSVAGSGPGCTAGDVDMPASLPVHSALSRHSLRSLQAPGSPSQPREDGGWESLPHDSSAVPIQSVQSALALEPTANSQFMRKVHVCSSSLTGSEAPPSRILS